MTGIPPLPVPSLERMAHWAEMDRRKRDGVPMTSPKTVVTLHEGVGDVLTAMLEQVRQQAASAGDSASDYTDLSRDLREVIAHEHSLLHSLLSVLRTNAHDGDLDLFTDQANGLSLFFRFASGYHGGLIYHPDRMDSSTGRWQVHT